MTVKLPPGAAVAAGFEHLFQQEEANSELDRGAGGPAPAAGWGAFPEDAKEQEISDITQAVLAEQAQVPPHHETLAKLPLEITFSRSTYNLPQVIWEKILALATNKTFPEVCRNFYQISKVSAYQLVKKLSGNEFFLEEPAPPLFVEVPGVRYPQHRECQVYLEKLNSKLKDQMSNDQWQKIIKDFPSPFDIKRFEAMQKVVQANDHATRVLWNKISGNLRFEGTPPHTLEEIRSWMKNKDNKAQLNNIKGISFILCGLKVIPSEIWHLTGLTHLDLQSNLISVIPPEIGRLADLEYLNLHGNQIRVIPPEVSHLLDSGILQLGQ